MKKIITTIFIILAIILIGNISNAASDFELNSVHFDANINTDGSMDVTETWKIEVNGLTNTLFKTFKLNDLGYSGISNVKVSEVIGNNEELEFTEKNVEVLHVDKNAYYGLINSKGDFEIAWGINETEGNKTYKISYKVQDCVKKYNDTAEVYWQFIGKDFDVDIDKITGTITTPNTSADKTTTRAWAHGPLNGNISIESANIVNFDLEYFDAGNYLEIRLAMPPEIFDVAIINMNRFDTILSEETRLADQANEIREQVRIENKKREEQFNMFKNILQIVGVAIGAGFLFKTNKYINALKENPKLVPENKSKYFRDIPDENATPGEAGFLYYYRGAGIANNLPKILSSTILDLAMKKYLEFEIVDTKNKKEQVRIRLLPKDIQGLKEDEQLIYELLEKIQGNEDGFNMKDLEKYAKKHYSTFLSKLEKVPDKAQKQITNQGMYDNGIHKNGLKWGGKTAIYSFGIFAVLAIGVITGNIVLAAILFILSLICLVICAIVSSRLNGLTQKGVDAQEQWKGLKRYMEDYSMIDDREVPELVIWEKYLVYATAFGIADKVLKQLKVQYPELADGNITNSTYLGMMYYNNLNNGIIDSINQATTRAYTTGVSQRASYDYSNSSSGGGFGGGFSGGGGFGGGGFGGGGRRRTIKQRKTEKKREKESINHKILKNQKNKKHKKDIEDISKTFII